MGRKILGLFGGTFIGMMVGALLIVFVCRYVWEPLSGMTFTKEPLMLILLIGIPVGGLVGGWRGVTWGQAAKSRSNHLVHRQI